MFEDDPIIMALTANQGTISDSANTTRKILNSETNRLIVKQEAILEARFGQNRVIDLNRDQMKRTAAYTKVGILTVVSLGIILVFRLLGDVIPDSVMTLIYVMLLSVCLFYGIYVYTDVNGREKTNYDRYDIPPPVINLSDAEKKKQLAAALAAGDLLAANALTTGGVCSGQGCCAYDQAYSSTTNQCAKCPTSGDNFIKANNACGACAGETPNYISATQSCFKCSTNADTSKLGYDDTAKACKAA
jgi:hypothetical protein